MDYDNGTIKLSNGDDRVRTIAETYEKNAENAQIMILRRYEIDSLTSARCKMTVFLLAQLYYTSEVCFLMVEQWLRLGFSHMSYGRLSII